MLDYLANISGLLDFQVDHTEHLLNVLRTHNAALDGSDMGTGKTYVASAIVRELDLPTLVVAPKTSLGKWERTAESMGTGVSAINYEMLTRSKTPYGEWYEDRGYPRFRWNTAIRMLVFDECHRFGGTKSLTSKLMIGAKHQNITSLGLSATTAETPLRMKAIGYLLGLYESPKIREARWVPGKGLISREQAGKAVSSPFRKWAAQYKCYEGWHGYDFYGDATDMEKIHRQLFPERGARIRIKDLGDRFPESQIEAELVDFEAAGKMNAFYERMEKEIQDLNDRTAGYNPQDPMLQALLERQTVELLKVPELVDMTLDLIDQGFSVVHFVNYRATQSALLERLVGAGIVTSQVHGDQSAKERTEELRRYQEDLARAIVLTGGAGSESLDLHDVRGQFPRYALINPPYEAWRLYQETGRVRRAGAKSKSFQRILCARGTGEETVYENLCAKKDCLDTLNDGDLSPIPFRVV